MHVVDGMETVSIQDKDASDSFTLLIISTVRSRSTVPVCTRYTKKERRGMG